MLKIKHNETLPKDYMSLRTRSGHQSCSQLAAVGAIKNSIFTTGIYQDDELLAFGRVCGDGQLYFLVCDIMVDERYTDPRFNLAVVKEIDDYLRLSATKDSQVLVKVERPTDELFRKLGYQYFDEDFELVMKR